MLRREASWLRLDAWLLTHCCVQRHHSQTLTIRSFWFLKTGLTVKVFSSEKWGFDFRESSGHAHVLLSRCVWINIAARNRSFLERVPSFFSFHLFHRHEHRGDRNLLPLCQSYQFLTWAFFKAFLMASWHITRGVLDRERSFSYSEAFKSCSTRWTVIFLTFSCFEKSQISWSPGVTKWIFKFF